MRRCPTSPRVARSVTARVSTEPRPPRAEPGRQSLRWVMPPTAPWAREAPRRVLVLFLLSLWDVCEARHCIHHTSDLPETMGWKPEEAAPPAFPPAGPHMPGVPFRCADRPALPSLGSRASGPGGVLLPSSRRDGVLHVFSICERRESCGGIERTLGKPVNQSNQRPWIWMVQPSILRVPKSLLQSSLPSWKAQS